MTHVRCSCARSTDCRKCDGLGFVPDALFADLTPDEARVITGLVRAMRAERVTVNPLPSNWHLANAMHALYDDNAAEAAWHIAHALDGLGDEDDA